MKRMFADLHLRLNPNDTTATKRFIAKAAALGYVLIGVPFSPETREAEIEKLRGICKDAKLDFASRVDLCPRTKDQLTYLIRKLRRKFEVDVKPLLVLDGPARVRFLSCLRREVSIAREFHVPVVVSSGVSVEMFLRKPREIAAFSSLFGLSEVSALDAVSANASAIVVRNRGKLDS